MADDPLNGNANPTPSPSETQTEVNPDVNNLGEPSTVEPSVEQSEWNKLSGKSQDRFSAIIREKNQLANKLDELESQRTQAQQDYTKVNQPGYPNQPYQPAQYPQPTYNPNPREDEVNKAVDTLKQRGFTTLDDVRDLVSEAVTTTTRNLNLQREHERLQSKYSSMPNAPRYNPEEVEDYGRRNNIFNPEAAYRDMYFDELQDLSGRAKPTKQISETPGASNMTRNDEGEPMTVEKLQEKLHGPSGKEWYNEQMRKNPKAFQKMISDLTTGG